jgi:hypothetical protein
VERILALSWRGTEAGPARGYTDLIPANWFSTEGRHLGGLSHKMEGPRGGFYRATCDVDVEGKSVTLVYTESDVHFAGTVRIEFADNTRSMVQDVLWEGKRAPVERSWREPEDYASQEGALRLHLHRRRERDLKLARAKIDDVLRKHNKICCEACGFDFAEHYGALGGEFGEVHHRVELSKEDERLVGLDDLAVLCANCHRMIHRTDPMATVDQFAKTHVKKRC